ncbi:MAG: NlpC/P60 family protein [Clostridia bacterium]|nr:NlpC/P60 family protein [Clostridia bacterium]
MTKIIPAQAFANQIVSKVRTPAIPYVLGGRSDRGTDCINLIAWVMKELGGQQVPRSSNDAWRNNMAWTGTLAEASAQGKLVPGTILYIDYHKPPGGSGGTPGAMDHAGVYVGNGHGLKTPDGRPGAVVHASLSRGGVYPSTLQNAWTHAAWLRGVAYGNGALKSVSALAPGQAQVITRTSGLLLREEPHTRGRRIKEMPIGAIVDVVRVENGWAYVHWNVRPGLYHAGWCCIGENGVDYLAFGGDTQ